MTDIVTADLILTDNSARADDLSFDYEKLAVQLERRGLSIEALTERAQDFSVAVPSWGVGTGGTRFARFPGLAEPRNIMERLEDCGVIHQLVRITGQVSPHFPWDVTDDMSEVADFARDQGLTFAAVNSNTFQDPAGAEVSYKFGSLTHTDQKTREAAIAHNVDCIRWGQDLGATSLTVWIGDGSNFPGQQHFSKSLERYLSSMRVIVDALPEDWRLLIEHKMFEPAFYSTVIQDWGTNILCAQELGPKVFSLVDLGHHAPNVNIEMIVARLIQFGKLGGFHFNDSKYGDDDLDAGSIHPYQQFLIFWELVDAERRDALPCRPEYMLDQSHNVTDPIESLMISAESVQRAYVQALLVDRDALEFHQEANDALMASQTLKTAFKTDVDPILKMARQRAGGAIDPVSTYRSARYRELLAPRRPALGGSGSGIV
ncbi:MAG: L-rhamnose catabolism isomerase [Pseudomonadota bacterium]